MRTSIICTLTAIALALTPAAGHAAPSEENHCLTPFGGAQGGDLIDLNELFGTTEAIIHPSYCPEVDAGERWIIGRGCIGWATSPEHGRYPRGYRPTGATPLEDFLSKLTVKVVVDAGTDHERVYLYRPDSDPSSVIVMLWSDFGSGPSPYGSEDNRLAILVPSNPAQPVGAHTADLYMVMSAEHWDGIGTNPKKNRLPAGETLVIGGNTFQTIAHS